MARIHRHILIVLGGGVCARLNAKNVFDKRDETCMTGRCYRAEGRNVIGSIRYRF